MLSFSLLSASLHRFFPTRPLYHFLDDCNLLYRAFRSFDAKGLHNSLLHDLSPLASALSHAIQLCISLCATLNIRVDHPYAFVLFPRPCFRPSTISLNRHFTQRQCAPRHSELVRVKSSTPERSSSKVALLVISVPPGRAMLAFVSVTPETCIGAFALDR